MPLQWGQTITGLGASANEVKALSQCGQVKESMLSLDLSMSAKPVKTNKSTPGTLQS
jgi:hypothetical protein